MLVVVIDVGVVLLLSPTTWEKVVSTLLSGLVMMTPISQPNMSITGTGDNMGLFHPSLQL